MRKLIKRLFGISHERISEDAMIPLLSGITRPLQQDGVLEQANSALRHISNQDAKGRFMKLLWHVCLSSVLQRICETDGLQRGLADSFEAFALSQWQRSPGMSLENEQVLFDFTRQQLGDQLKTPEDNTLVEVGITLLSLAIHDQKEFSTGVAFEWGQVAHSCWTLATLETDRALGISGEIDFTRAKVDEQVFLLNYSDHYSDILGDHLTKSRLAELFLFRAWTAQFGYRVFSSDFVKSEKLIGEVVNASEHFGLPFFEKIHRFSIESELGADFISLVEDRWGVYDSVIPARVAADGIPTMEIVIILGKRLEIEDGLVTFGLSVDFLAQLNLIRETAIEIGVLNA